MQSPLPRRSTVRSEDGPVTPGMSRPGPWVHAEPGFTARPSMLGDLITTVHEVIILGHRGVSPVLSP